MKNCLNCCYEPDWGIWHGTAYKRCFGKCKCPVVIPVLPASYKVSEEPIIKYDDGSGIKTQCKTWTAKTQENHLLDLTGNGDGLRGLKKRQVN